MILFNLCELSGTSIATNTVEYNDWYAANLLTPIPDAQFRTTDETSLTLTVSLSDFRQFSSIGIFGHNLTQTAEISLSSTLDGESTIHGSFTANEAIYSPFELPPFSHRPFGYSVGDELDASLPHTAIFIDQHIAETITITINDPLNLDGYIRAGYLMIGDTFSPKYNFSYGAISGSQVSNSKSYVDGVSFGKYEDIGRSATIPLADLSVTESNTIDRAMRYCISKNQPIFISMYEGQGGALQTRTEILCRVDSYSPPAPTAPNKFQTSLQLTESVM